MLNKKAQIGATLTWIAATLLIFFIMVVYVVAVAGIIARGEISKKEVNLMQSTTSSNFIAFLSQEVEFNGKNIKISDLFVGVREEGSFGGKYYERLKKELEDFINKDKYECYIVEVEDAKVPAIVSKIEEGGRRYSRQAESGFLEQKGSSVNVLGNKEDVKINYYFGEC